jgi:glycosyltransferase involved in cell wall biosynthesis
VVGDTTCIDPSRRPGTFSDAQERSSAEEGPPQTKRDSISVVVPVFGNGDDLADLAARVDTALRGTDWELIFVNDGSPPSVWEAIQCLAAGRPRVRGINLRRNFGQQNALLAGIRASRGDVIVTMDDDLQHPPEEITRLLERMDSADVVYGTPVTRVRGWSRNFAAAVTKAALASVLGAAHARDIAAFRAFRGSLRPVFAQYHSPYVSIDVLLSWSTSRIAAVPVRYAPRRHGGSGYTLHRLMTVTLNMVTGFSVWPLRVASIIGLAVAAFGVLVLAFVIARYLTAEATVPGFAFLASVTAIFAGAQLFGIGIIGEYLARMHFRTMDKPAYVVESTANLRMPDDTP